MAEQTDCAGAALTKHPENYLRIGARYWSNQGDMSHQQGSSQFRGDIDVRRPRPSIHSPPCPLLSRGCVVGRRCCFSAGRVRPIRSASLTWPTSIRAPTGQAAAEATSSAGAWVALCIRVPVDLSKTMHSNVCLRRHRRHPHPRRQPSRRRPSGTRGMLRTHCRPCPSPPSAPRASPAYRGP